MKRNLLLFAVAAAACAPSAPTTTPAAVAAASTRLAAATDQYLTVGGARLRYREVGRGEPVVLLHGYAQRLELISELADSLARDYRVIVPDQRGFGESSKFADPTRFGRVMGDDVIALLDALRLRQAHLVGHSMGALVAANVAARFPDRVRTAALIAGPFYPDSAAFTSLSAAWVTALERGEGFRAFLMWLFPGMSDSIATGAGAQILAANDMGSLIAAMRAMGGLVVSRESAGGIRAPALVAVGTGDPLLPQSRAIAAWWPAARLLEIPGVNHFDVLLRPEVIGGIRVLIGGGGSR
jgi:pimeloyl-ACP methyl ester carboxylesterase